MKKVELLIFFYANVHIYVKGLCFREDVGGRAAYGNVVLYISIGILEFLGKVIFYHEISLAPPSFLSLHSPSPSPSPTA